VPPHRDRRFKAPPGREGGDAAGSGRFAAWGRPSDSRVHPDVAAPELWEDGFAVQTVLIVDDHPGFRSQARRLLEAAGFEVVGEAEDGASAVDSARLLRPAIVLLDVQLPDIDGFEVARRLADADIDAATVLISTRDNVAYRRRLAASTARGFIPKSELTGASLMGLVE
jgi:CheY-like chemotaxis protein